MPVPRLPAGDTDRELVERAAGGDQLALARLVRVHHEALTRVALVVTLDPELAARAVHDTWPTACSRLARLPAGTPFLPWAAGLVLDRAAEIAGRDGRRRPMPAPRPEADAGSLGARLAELPLRDRSLVALHVLAGIGSADLARRERRPTAEVRARLAVLLGTLAGPSRIRAWAERDVRPVDSDATAAWAMAEATSARTQRWSVLAGALAGILVAGLPYIGRLLNGP
jgi:DNA-directed RNA polymerase specialized sigma24 family protein